MFLAASTMLQYNIVSSELAWNYMVNLFPHITNTMSFGGDQPDALSILASGVISENRLQVL